MLDSTRKNNKKKAIVTGSMGQDGFFLTKELIENSYEVVGIIRGSNKEISGLNHSVIIGDLTDPEFVEYLIKEVKPTHIFNLAGESNVFQPHEDVDKTYLQNCKIPQNILSSIVKYDRDIRFFQASSSLMYGRSNEFKINEDSKFSPIYPYGISKLYSHNMVGEFRNHYNIFACSGIFFNHESEKRGNNFFNRTARFPSITSTQSRTGKVE
jgi:GDPmannose 4,6-dehydratase